MGWYLLDKYYQKTDEAPIYAAALLLNPRNRVAYLNRNWPKAWIKPSIKHANEMFKDSYKYAISTDVDQADCEPLPPKRARNELDNLLDSLRSKPPLTSSVDDFNTFIAGDQIDIGELTPLQWWCKEDQRQRYPQLHRMAIAILSIPPESAESERVFSGARRTCSWDRLRLKPTKIEVIESIGSWLREGLITEPQHQEVDITIGNEGFTAEDAAESDIDEELEVSCLIQTL
jgi:hypothetical protein